LHSDSPFPHKTSTIKTIYFIRHAQATGQAPDAALTKQGLDHSHSLVHYFKDKNIQVILSSPYLRAMTTVEPIAHSKQLPIIPDYRLREFHPCADANDVHYET
jgi:2,3-bisphosphoglycerate-dependent phosphoglycerate mutase